MGLRGTEARLPPGFRFHPRDEELVCYYLYGKIGNRGGGGGGGDDSMVEVDLHTCPPWKLPLEAKLGANEWYFFNFRDRKYATGSRTNRATTEGYWKATGKDRSVHDPVTEAVVGMRKTLVFYLGRAPKGIKTSWVMHEFRVENPNMPPKEDWVLCRVFKQTRGDPPKLLGMEYENYSTNPSHTDHNHDQLMYHHHHHHHPVLSHEYVVEHSSSSALDHHMHHHQVHDQHGHEVLVQNPFMHPSSDHFSIHHTTCCSTSSASVFLNSTASSTCMEIMGELQYHHDQSLYLPPLMMMERSDHHVDKFEFLEEDIRMEEEKLGCRDFGLINVAAHDQDQEIVLE